MSQERGRSGTSGLGGQIRQGRGFRSGSVRCFWVRGREDPIQVLGACSPPARGPRSPARSPATSCTMAVRDPGLCRPQMPLADSRVLPERNRLIITRSRCRSSEHVVQTPRPAPSVPAASKSELTNDRPAEPGTQQAETGALGSQVPWGRRCRVWAWLPRALPPVLQRQRPAIAPAQGSWDVLPQ